MVLNQAMITYVPTKKLPNKKLIKQNINYGMINCKHPFSPEGKSAPKRREEPPDQQLWFLKQTLRISCIRQTTIQYFFYILAHLLAP